MTRRWQRNADGHLVARGVSHDARDGSVWYRVRDDGVGYALDRYTDASDRWEPVVHGLTLRGAKGRAERMGLGDP